MSEGLLATVLRAGEENAVPRWQLLEDLRKLVLHCGFGVLPETPSCESWEMSNRGFAWTAFVNAPPAEDGAFYVKSIRDALKGNRSLVDSITSAVGSLSAFGSGKRICAAVDSRSIVRCTSASAVRGVAFVPEVLTLVEALLVLLPEPEAFNVLCTIAQYHAPTLISVDSTAESVLTSAQIACVCLRVADGALYSHLETRAHWSPQLLVPWVRSLGVGMGSFAESVHVLDYLFCFGVHLIAPVIACHLAACRIQLMQCADVTEVTLSSLHLDARKTISGCCAFLLRAPDDLCRLIAAHTLEKGLIVPQSLLSPKPLKITFQRTPSSAR